MRTALDVALAAVAIAASVFGFRNDGRRSERRAAIFDLQGASATPWPDVPGVCISAVVLSAAPSPAGGGDIVDVFELDARFSLLLVADVSGKGAAAAAQTAFIRYTIRTLALESDGNPAIILARFNAIYEHTIQDDEAFVVLIVGIMDAHTGDLRYASAGHEAAFLRRRGGSVTLLAPTGPIVGAAPLSSYGSDMVTLERGDILVWATDGMTESRDRKRRLLGADGLASWVAAAPHDVGAVANWLVASLRRRSGGSGQDDVAVLAVAYHSDSVLVPPVAPPNRYGALPGDLLDRRLSD